MTCSTWQSQLDRYVDGELSAPESSSLEAHLQTCTACAHEALARTRLKNAVRVAGMRYQARPEFRREIAKRMARKEKKSTLWTWGWSVAAASACVALLAVLGGSWMVSRERRATFRELADLHVNALASANPVDVVSTDRHTVKPWFQGKLPYTFNLPELGGSPYTLVGGKLVYVHERPAAQLLFQLRKHYISVFIVEDNMGYERLAIDRLQTQVRNFQLQGWEESGVRYFLISDAGAEDVAGLSRLLRRAAQAGAGQPSKE